MPGAGGVQRRVIVTVVGASGFIGTHLVRALRARGDEVRTASMRDPRAAAHSAAGADAVLNFAGEPLAGRRWTAEVKRKIEASRVDATRAFLDALRDQPARPGTYIGGSAVGYYGTSLQATFTESDGPGNDFLALTCSAWEREARAAANLGMRVECIRTGLVLGRDGGALATILPIFRAGAGGPIGTGRQWHSWIHIDDEIGIILHALDHGRGAAYNATAPNPVRNAEFTRALAAALHRPAIVPAPAFALRLLFGEAAGVVLDGQRVLPARALAEGYAFKYPAIDAACAAVAAR